MPWLGQTRGQHPMHQNYHRCGVSLMAAATRLWRNAGLAAALLMVLAASSSPARAQAPAENWVEQLAGGEAAVDLDFAAVRQQALERSKSRATAAPANRPP